MWIWETNPEDLKEAEKALKDFEVEEQVNKIDDLIEEWNNYKDALKEITTAYQEEADEQAFINSQAYITLVGIENKDLSQIEKFKNSYKSKQKAIANNTTDSIDKQIDSWNELKEKYSDISKNYEFEQNKQAAIAAYGANVEQDILAGRMSVIQNFTNGYIAEMNAQASAAESAASRIGAAYGNYQVPDVSLNYVSGLNWDEEAIGTVTGLTGKHNIYYQAQSGSVVPGRTTNAKQFTVFERKVGTGKDIGYVFYKVDSRSDSWIRVKTSTDSKNYKKAAIGTKSSSGNLYNLNELGEELIVPPSKGNYQFLQKGTGVVPHNLTERLMNMAYNPYSYIHAAMSQMGISANSNSKGVGDRIINIQNLNLPNVKDSNGFIRELQLISQNR